MSYPNRKTKIINILLRLLPLMAIAVLSIIPAYYTAGRLAIGGDVMIFLDTKVLADKYLYQWIINSPNGDYFSTSYYALYGFYKALSFLGLDVYGISFLQLFTLNFVAGIAIWKLAKVFKTNVPQYLFMVPIAFYLLSPALFNTWHYSVIYAFIPWFIYLTFKVIKNRTISNADVFYFAIVILFSSTELPNPKYLFHLFTIFLIAIILATCLKALNFSEVKRMILKVILILLLSSYLFVPLAYFAKNYSPEQYGVHVKQGYQDQGEFMNTGTDTVDKVFKLHQNSIFLNSAPAEIYNKSKSITMLSYAFIFIIFLSLLNFKDLPGEQKKFRLILLALLASYIFFSAGPNPPFGYVYQLMVSEISLFAFLRTTAGGVFFLSAFYSILLFLFISDLKRFKLLVSVIIFLIICYVGRPFLNGEYYKNFNNVSKFTERNQYGFKIPSEYLDVKKVLDDKKLDAKIYYPNSKLVYMNTTWGFFGPIIYNFIYQNQNISYDKMYSSLSNHNIGFVLIDNSILEKEFFDQVKDKAIIMKANYLELSSYTRDKFLPHIYSAKNVIISDQNIEVLPSVTNQPDYGLRSLILLKSQNKKTNLSQIVSSENTPIIEYKKVNITKYQVKIHDAKGSFPLVFSESYNPGWKAYMVPSQSAQYNSKQTLITQSDSYNVLRNNEEDQASKEELVRFINDGIISTLGKTDSPEFVSKNFQDTIQNDNLENGNIFETWRKPVINENEHYIANGYANAWIVNVTEICKNQQICEKTDKGYNINLIIEFWPQRLVYYGLIITATTAVLLLTFSGWIYLRRKK